MTAEEREEVERRYRWGLLMCGWHATTMPTHDAVHVRDNETQRSTCECPEPGPATNSRLWSDGCATWCFMPLRVAAPLVNQEDQEVKGEGSEQ
jgi:hypothetical protein